VRVNLEVAGCLPEIRDALTSDLALVGSSESGVLCRNHVPHEFRQVFGGIVGVLMGPAQSSAPSSRCTPPSRDARARSRRCAPASALVIVVSVLVEAPLLDRRHRRRSDRLARFNGMYTTTLNWQSFSR
jgi:hypothetical protein